MVMVVYILYLFGPLTALILGLFSSLVPRRSLLVPRPSSLRWIIESVVLVVLAGGTALFSHNKGLKVMLEVDYCAYHKQWPQVLTASRRHPANFLTVHLVNRALYHTGRLGSDMFSFPQHINTLLLTDKDYVESYWQKFDAYLELGFINRAEHELTVSLEQFGEHPVILKRLALVNMVKGNLDTARVYLNVLSKTLFDAGWADNYLDKIESASDLAADGRIKYLRSLMMENNYGYTSIDGEKILSDLLARNKQNRMAFEYLMSSFLITIQLDKLVQNIYRLDDFDYPQIPRLYEEAILIYEYLRHKAVDLHGRQISLQSRRRFDSFNQIYIGRYRQNKQAAFNELAENYGDSYFFYYLYGLSGIKK